MKACEASTPRAPSGICMPMAAEREVVVDRVGVEPTAFRVQGGRYYH